MWLLLFVPIIVLVLLVVTVSTLFAGLFWVLGAGWPVLLIALGAWLFWHEDGRHARRGRWGSGPRAVPSADQRQKSAQQPNDKRSASARGRCASPSCRSTCRSKSSRSAARLTCC